MSKSVLTPAAVMELKRLYAEVDERGRRVYSMMQLASRFAVGETTVYRALNKQGGYARVRDLPTSEEAAESKKRFLELMAAEAAPAEPPAEDPGRDLAKKAGYL